MKPSIIIKKDDSKININFSKEYIESVYRLVTARESILTLSHEIYKDDWTNNNIVIMINNSKSFGHGIDTNMQIPVNISIVVYIYEDDSIKAKWESYALGNFTNDMTLEQWIIQFSSFTSDSEKWKKDIEWIKDNFNREIDISVE